MKGYWLTTVPMLGFVYLAGGCKREERGFGVDPPKAEIINAKALSSLHPAADLRPRRRRTITSKTRRLFPKESSSIPISIASDATPMGEGEWDRR